MTITWTSTLSWSGLAYRSVERIEETDPWTDGVRPPLLKTRSSWPEKKWKKLIFSFIIFFFSFKWSFNFCYVFLGPRKTFNINRKIISTTKLDLPYGIHMSDQGLGQPGSIWSYKPDDNINRDYIKWLPL